METKKKIKLILDILGIHPSNLMLYAVGAWFIFVYIIPFLDGYFGFQEATGNNIVKVQELENKIMKMEAAQKEMLSQRKAGNVGITYH